MATSTLNISLPESQRLFVEEKIKNEGYSTISEYVRELIRQEQKKEELKEMKREILRQEIQKGIDDMKEGRFITLQTPEDYEQLADEIIKEGRAKLAERRNDKQTK